MAALNTWAYFGVDTSGGTLGVYGAPAASIHLSDGSLVFASTDYGNHLTGTRVTHLSNDRGTLTDLLAVAPSWASFASQSFDICTDASDNIYVLCGDTTTAAMKMYALIKGTGDQWTATGVMTVNLSAFVNLNLYTARMVWCNTTGGTGGHGHILLCLCASTGSEGNYYCTLDAGALLAGTASTYVNGSASPTFLSTTTVGSVMDLAPATFGATSGLAVCSGVTTTSTTLNVGAWALNSSGALSTNSHIGTITGTGIVYAGGNNPISTPCQVVSLASPFNAYSPASYLITYPTSGGAFGTAFYNSSTGLVVTTAAPTTINGMTGYNWSTIAGGTMGAIYVDPTTADTVWMVMPQVRVSPAGAVTTASNGVILQLRGVINLVAPSITWDTTPLVVDTIDSQITLPYVWSAATPGLAVRAIPNPRTGIVDIMANANTGVPLTGGAYIYGTAVVSAPQPVAPVLLTPANGAVVDLAAGQTFAWTPDQYSAQGWYGFQREDPSGDITWWNGSTFQSAECWVNATVDDLVFAADLWADFGTAYTWWVRTLNQWQVVSLTPAPFGVTGAASPAVTPSASGIATSTPSISWTIVPGSFSTTQVSYRVIIGVSGFTPITGASLYDTGIVSSRTVASVKSGVLLANGNYDAYVIIVMSDGSTNGTAAKVSFTVTISGAPATPTLTATVDTSNDRVLLTVTGTGSNTAFVEYSDDGGSTWAQIRNTNDSPADYAYVQLSGGVGTVYDYELIPGTQRTYQAAQVSNVGVFSAYSSTVTATLSPTDWWWKNPLFPTENMIVVIQPPFKTKIMETLGEYRPLVEPGVPSFPVFSSGGVQGVDGTIQVLTITKAQFASLVTLYRYAGTTLLQSPFGYQWYIRVNAPRQPIQDPGTSTNPRRVTTLAYAQVAKPVIVPVLPATVPIQSQRAAARIRTAVTATQAAHARIG